jgi:hypothetical protein
MARGVGAPGVVPCVVVAEVQDGELRQVAALNESR